MFDTVLYGVDTLHQLVKWGFVLDTGDVFFSYIDGISCFWSSDFTVFICHVLLLIILLIITAYESVPLSYR